jgi:hypothetical protein
MRRLVRLPERNINQNKTVSPEGKSALRVLPGKEKHNIRQGNNPYFLYETIII